MKDFSKRNILAELSVAANPIFSTTAFYLENFGIMIYIIFNEKH